MDVFVYKFLVFLLGLKLTPFLSTEASLTNNLKHYEILHADTPLHKIVKRGLKESHHPFNKIKEIEFDTLGRNFRLILNPSVTVLHPNFKAYVVDADGKQNHVTVERENFFKGRVFGEAKSEVGLHIQDGLMTGSIHLPDEIYHIEPSWRHLPHLDNRTMITYRESDVKLSWQKGDLDADELGVKTCGYVRDGRDEDDDDGDGLHRIQKRQSESGDLVFTRTRCPLLLVADYRFYREMGGGNSRTTINYLISLIDRVHKMYNDTIWQDGPNVPGFTGFGFVIKKILVHSAPTYTYDGVEHYNMNRREWDVRRLLEVFSRNAENKQYCLAHLFTHQTFDNRVVLGLAYIASNRLTSPGGICSIEYSREKIPLYLNAGLSSSRTHYGQRVITREADLVTAHEFGHNWGSEHDPDTEECSPSARRGGSFLMYTYSVSGYDFNNKLFSPCSKRAIKKVLQAKSHLCFTEPQESFCGNLKVEGDEECDAGLLGTEGNDRCCDKDCKLKDGAVCSDKNFPCCESCQFSQSGMKCREAQNSICEQESYCNGVSAICPKSSALPDLTECQDRGKCINGTCTSYCETEGLQSCMCDKTENACKRCCRAHINSTCSPVEPVDILPDGTPCIQGFCNNGKCEKVIQDVVERFWKIIEDININKVLLFLKDNIVGTVIIVTAVIWVPASYVINRVDVQRNVEEKERLSWSNSNDFVYVEEPSVLHVTPKYRVVLPGNHPVATAVIPE